MPSHRTADTGPGPLTFSSAIPDGDTLTVCRSIAEKAMPGLLQPNTDELLGQRKVAFLPYAISRSPILFPEKDSSEAAKQRKCLIFRNSQH